jgi:Protein of unknown function (DUF5661)
MSRTKGWSVGAATRVTSSIAAAVERSVVEQGVASSFQGVRGGAAMTDRSSFTVDEARRIGEKIGIEWDSAPFDVDQFRMGMDVELEHGLHDLSTNVTDSDPVVTGKIALAHLNEFPDYYTRLERMEEEAKLAHSKDA